MPLAYLCTPATTASAGVVIGDSDGWLPAGMMPSCAPVFAVMQTPVPGTSCNSSACRKQLAELSTPAFTALTLENCATAALCSPPAVLDIVGTGGDGIGSVNISTGATVVAAAAGAKVAKHGNRSGALG